MIKSQNTRRAFTLFSFIAAIMNSGIPIYSKNEAIRPAKREGYIKDACRDNRYNKFKKY